MYFFMSVFQVQSKVFTLLFSFLDHPTRTDLIQLNMCGISILLSTGAAVHTLWTILCIREIEPHPLPIYINSYDSKLYLLVFFNAFKKGLANKTTFWQTKAIVQTASLQRYLEAVKKHAFLGDSRKAYIDKKHFGRRVHPTFRKCKICLQLH